MFDKLISREEIVKSAEQLGDFEKQLKSEMDQWISDLTPAELDKLGPELRGQFATMLENVANMIQSELIRLSSHVRHA